MLSITIKDPLLTCTTFSQTPRGQSICDEQKTAHLWRFSAGEKSKFFLQFAVYLKLPCAGNLCIAGSATD